MDGKPFHPDCWTDDRRMKVLFAPLRTRSVNPENYDSVIQFWRDLIVKYCDSVSGHPEVTITGLRTAFARDGQRPHCLQEVLQVLERTGHVKRKDLFMEEPDSSWTKWTVNLMKKPLLWSLQQVKHKILPPSSDEEVSYIVLEVVNNQAERLLENLKNQILSLQDVKRRLKGLDISEDALRFVLHELYCRQRVYIQSIGEGATDDKILLKFGTQMSKTSPLTDLETSIHTLEATERELSHVIGEMEVEMHNQEELAKQLLSEKKRVLARNCLRKRNQMSVNLEKRTKCLENVQAILTKIHAVSSDAKVLEAYRLGTKSLQAALTGSGITLDSVEQVIHEMQDVIELHDDIQGAISEPPIVEANEADLERELEELLEEETGATETTVETKTVIEDSIIAQLDKLTVVDDSLGDEVQLDESKEMLPAT